MPSQPPQIFPLREPKACASHEPQTCTKTGYSGIWICLEIDGKKHGFIMCFHKMFQRTHVEVIWSCYVSSFWVKPAFSRRMLLQPLLKVQPLACRLGNEHHVLTMTCRRHWLIKESKSQKKAAHMKIIKYQKLKKPLMQDCTAECHLITEQSCHFFTTPKASKSVRVSEAQCHIRMHLQSLL